MIKMPDAVAPEASKSQTNTEPQASLSLVQANTELGMFESGVLAASMKPIVKAKAKKVISFIKNSKDAYEHGTEEQKKDIQGKAESLIMMGTGTRAFASDLCEMLWSES